MSICAVNNISFASQTNKRPKESKKKEYVGTNAFKIAGAVVGLASTGAVALLNKPQNFELTKGQIGLIGLALVAAGALLGSLQDFIINKTVKNTVLSIKNNND